MYCRMNCLLKYAFLSLMVLLVRKIEVAVVVLVGCLVHLLATAACAQLNPSVITYPYTNLLFIAGRLATVQQLKAHPFYVIWLWCTDAQSVLQKLITRAFTGMHCCRCCPIELISEHHTHPQTS